MKNGGRQSPRVAAAVIIVGGPGKEESAARCRGKGKVIGDERGRGEENWPVDSTQRREEISTQRSLARSGDEREERSGAYTRDKFFSALLFLLRVSY